MSLTTNDKDKKCEHLPTCSMQAKKRYLFVVILAVLLFIVYFGSKSDRKHGEVTLSLEKREFPTYMESEAVDLSSPRRRRESVTSDFKSGKCRMDTCFDFSRCVRGFKVYVYPVLERVSESYSKIISTIQESKYYTTNPDEACIFILSIDTLDRDINSVNSAKNIMPKIAHLGALWNNGRNHIVFNLFSGTWPDYSEVLDFDTGEAIMARASISESRFRPNFDISLPLVGSTHPPKGGERGYMYTSINNIPPLRHYLLGFKGKRYLTGVGSETRNSLYHMHNGDDIVLLTTCRHGKFWQKKAKELNDTRCDIDNREFDRYDYKKLLYNATFCLVPRGRRLGSFRFLETLQAGCIPVLLSNGWELPFGEVIDWKKAAVWADERLLFQVPSIVHGLSQPEIFAMRQQTQFLWEAYFSSMDKIINTVLEIVKDRVKSYFSRNSVHWNNFPGALSLLPEYSDVLHTYPSFYRQFAYKSDNQFTAVVYATSPVLLSSAPLFRLIRTVAKSTFVQKIVVIWNCDTPPPPSYQWPADLGIPILVKTKILRSVSARFYPYEEIETDAVFNLDEDSLLTTDELNFAFKVWKEFPERIVGYPARNHYWDEAKNAWSYTSKWLNEYSMVLTSGAIYNRYYNFLYFNTLRPAAYHIVERLQNCEDILMNFIVSDVTKLPPIKVTHRKVSKETMLPGKAVTDPNYYQTRFKQRQGCVASLTEIFGYMPLVRSRSRMDPVLWKDSVSNLRKKYRQLEVI